MMMGAAFRNARGRWAGQEHAGNLELASVEVGLEFSSRDTPGPQLSHLWMKSSDSPDL